MQSDRQAFVQGLRMMAAAVVSAVVTATVVIGAGQAWRSHDGGQASQISDPASGGRVILAAG